MISYSYRMAHATAQTSTADTQWPQQQLFADAWVWTTCVNMGGLVAIVVVVVVSWNVCRYCCTAGHTNIGAVMIGSIAAFDLKCKLFSNKQQQQPTDQLISFFELSETHSLSSWFCRFTLHNRHYSDQQVQWTVQEIERKRSSLWLMCAVVVSFVCNNNNNNNLCVVIN